MFMIKPLRNRTVREILPNDLMERQIQEEKTMDMFESGRKSPAGERWLHPINEKRRLRQYYLLYTALFILVSLFVFCWYYIPGRTLIWKSDGWNQHYKALVYFAQYMRSFIRELLYNHRLVFPEWDFALGEGNSILQSMHYYVIGDPFAVLSVFIPTDFMWAYYDFMVLFRLYLSGIAFSALCFYTQKNIGKIAVAAGALSYAFCYWALYNANRHPYFLNPMLYYPLIILGVEKILRKEKPYLLILTVFLASISNFYFFYNIVILTVVYVAVRLIARYKSDFRSMMIALGQIAGASVLGTMMGGIILLPVIVAFLSDARMGSGNAWPLLYPLPYYSKLLTTFLYVSENYWLRTGFSAPALLAVFLLFMRKKRNGLLKSFFIICSLIILFPSLGQILNGMSYMSNKWCWAFCLLCTYIFTSMWPELMNLNSKDALKLACALGFYFLGLLFLDYSRNVECFACIGIAFLFLLVVFPVQLENTREEARRRKWKQSMAFMLVIMGIATISFFLNAFGTNNYAAEAKTPAEAIEQLMLTEAKAVKEVAESDGETNFYRYSGRSLTHNTGTLHHMSNTEYYWSISNPAISSFRRALEMREPMAQSYQGYDDRTALIALSSVKYYVVPDSDKVAVPYGFTYVDSINVKEELTERALGLLRCELGTEELSSAQTSVIESMTASRYKVYRNDNALPLTYVYHNIISEGKWNELSAMEKQEAMLQGVMLADYDGETQDDAIRYSSQSLDYSVKCNSTGVTLQDYGFVVTTTNSTVTFNFEGLENSETCFVIRGLEFDGITNHERYLGDAKYDPLNLWTETRWNLLSFAERETADKAHLFRSENTTANLTVKASSGVSKTINYYTDYYSWYNDRHDYTVNLDYSEKAVTSITVTFPSLGIYSFDSIEIICQPMDDYVEQVAALKENGLENVRIGTDIVTGSITLDEPRILCFSIPYSNGWTAYVDDREAPLYQANIKNMALVLDAGKHDVRLIYHTPYLRHGAILSALGFVGFLALVCVRTFKKRRLTEEK